MADVLEVNNLHLRTRVGFSAHEIDKIQDINITIKLYTDTLIAGVNDDVDQCVNIRSLTKDIIKTVEEKTYSLIEAIANDIAYIAILNKKVNTVKVKVEKPNAIRFSNFSAITIKRKLSDFTLYNIAISIGSNINPHVNVPLAIEKISEQIGGIENISHCYETPSIDSSFSENDQEHFVNLAIEIKTYLCPWKLKEKLRKIEDEMGRVRDENDKFLPRTIDLDISVYRGLNKNSITSWLNEQEIQRFPHITVPLADIMPLFEDEKSGRTIFQTAQDLTMLNSPSTYFPKVEFDYLSKFLERNRDLDITKTLGSNLYITEETNDNQTNYSLTAGIIKKVKIALITGGASKIGKHITHKLHSMGYNVAVHYCNGRDSALLLINELNKIRDESAIAVQGDFSKTPKIIAQQMVEMVISKWNSLDVLVNNASVFVETDLAVCSEETWNTVNNTNLSMPFFLIQSALPYFVNDTGCVINICDIHGDRPLLNHSAYSVSKSGLIALTKSMAKDMGKYGVRVNGINPGAIFWMNGKHTDEFRKSTLSKTALNSLGSAKDVCDTVEFLIKSSYVTGQIINVDGGRTLNQ